MRSHTGKNHFKWYGGEIVFLKQIQKVYDYTFLFNSVKMLEY